LQAPGFIKHPQHTVVITPAGRPITVHAADVEIATSSNALVLKENGYEPVYYLPMQDINCDLMRASETETYCPFKGTASYWHLVLKNTTIVDALWAYQDPFDECLSLKNTAAFYTTKVSLTIKTLKDSS